MDGLAFVQLIETELAKRQIPKERFYKESGISSANMSQWRKRIYSPSADAIRKVEEYFGINLVLAQKNNAPGEFSLTEDEQELIRVFRMVPPERRNAVIATIRTAFVIEKI